MSIKPQQTKILVAHLGARKHYQEPVLFHFWGMLEEFCTDFYAGESTITKLLRNKKIYNNLPNVLKKGIDRYDPALNKAKVTHFPKFGYKFTQSIKRTLPHERARIFVWAGKEFGQRIIQKGLGNANVVYGFNGESLELFEYAKARGIRCVLDQTIAERSLLHQLLLEEEQTWKDWSLSPFTVNDADLELMQREQREQDLADHIICGSQFVKDSLIARGVSADKVSVVALGCSKDSRSSQNNYKRENSQDRGDELRLLFAGAVGLRKGIPYLLEALRLLKGKISFTCKVAGSIDIKPDQISKYSDVCKFLGRVPRSQMAELYSWADVFVLPSICEGSAMVTYEALGYGLPIVTTYNSGSIIRDKVDGYIVPVKNSVAIADSLLDLYKDKYQLALASNHEYINQVSKTSQEILMQVVAS